MLHGSSIPRIAVREDEAYYQRLMASLIASVTVRSCRKVSLSVASFYASVAYERSIQTYVIVTNNDQFERANAIFLNVSFIYSCKTLPPYTQILSIYRYFADYIFTAGKRKVYIHF